MPRRPLMTAILVGVLATAACTSDGPVRRATPPASSTAPTTSTGTGTATATAPSPAAVDKIKFSDCTEQIKPSLPGGNGPRVTRLSFGCGRVSVPVEYDHPNGPSLQVYVIKVHDNSQSRRTGALLVNPGGPGGSGVQLAVGLGLEVSDAVLDHFDLIGFDPRGVFLSNPVQCISDAEKDRLVAAAPDVRTAAGLTGAKRLASGVATACAAKYGTGLGTFSTEATARDMDVIRRALGEKQMNFLGYSYGTRLGTAYAHLFPTTIRAMILDGAVDPTATEVVGSERQVAGFESAFDRFAADCRKRPACRGLGNARPTVAALAAEADRAPIRTSRTGDRRRATGAIVLGATAAALYDQDRWPTLGTALLAARRGDAKGLFALTDAYNQRDADGKYSNLIDAFTAVSCNDNPTRLTDAQIQALARRWAPKYPLFGLSAAVALTTCQAWPATRTPVPPADAADAEPILVIGTVHDPATPYASAKALVKALGSGVLLTWDGDGHTAFPKTPCVTKAVEAYLIELTVPGPAATCPLR